MSDTWPRPYASRPAKRTLVRRGDPNTFEENSRPSTCHSHQHASSRVVRGTTAIVLPFASTRRSRAILHCVASLSRAHTALRRAVDGTDGRALGRALGRAGRAVRGAFRPAGFGDATCGRDVVVREVCPFDGVVARVVRGVARLGALARARSSRARGLARPPAATPTRVGRHRRRGVFPRRFLVV